MIQKDRSFPKSYQSVGPPPLSRLAHTGDSNVLSGSLCGVSVLAQGSDLRGHGVLVMPPRPTVSVCPQCVQTNKAQGPF